MDLLCTCWFSLALLFLGRISLCILSGKSSWHCLLVMTQHWHTYQLNLWSGKNRQVAHYQYKETDKTFPPKMPTKAKKKLLLHHWHSINYHETKTDIYKGRMIPCLPLSRPASVSDTLLMRLIFYQWTGWYAPTQPVQQVTCWMHLHSGIL